MNQRIEITKTVLDVIMRPNVVMRDESGSSAPLEKERLTYNKAEI